VPAPNHEISGSVTARQRPAFQRPAFRIGLLAGAQGAPRQDPVRGGRRRTGGDWLLITGWWVTAALGVAGIAATLLVRRQLIGGDLASNLGEALAGIYYACLGVLVVRRAGNVIGWLLLGEGFALAAEDVANAYAIGGLRGGGRLPWAELAGLFAEWAFVPVIAGFIGTFLLFPDGRLPSRRWWPVGWFGIAATGLALAGFVVHPRLVALPAPGGVSVSYPNPLGVTLGPVWSTLLVGTPNGLAVLTLPLFAAAVVSLAVRFRAGGREVREQIKWLAFMMALMLATQVVALAGIATARGSMYNPVTGPAYALSAVIALAGMPAVVTLAILKYRLYQIDVIINRTVKYALLSAALTAVYAAIVLGIGTAAGYAGGPLLTATAAVAVAVLFQPARSRAQLLANRLVYGRRASPYQVLADFAEHMAGQLDTTAALSRVAALLGGATGAVLVRVWVRVGAGFRSAVTWPAGEQETGEEAQVVRDEYGLSLSGSGPRRVSLTAHAGERTAEVRHSGELLGALTLVKRADEPVSAAEESLLANVASQAGLLLRNARLTAELRATIDDLTASRRRLVRAQDEERHRIERNLHDGAQQQLVALAMLLSLVEDAADDPAEVRQLAAKLKDGVHAAIEELRALARGIYPPLLAEQGLPAALRAQAGRSSLPVRVEADGVGRYRREAEAAVYFCVLEALQNAAKHARARQATVALACGNGHLEFSVTDDGAGFDPAAVAGAADRAGTGLQGMADRLAAAGGTLGVRSAPGAGTVVSGQIPV
jgi:signal transduction histidine kinase